MKTVAIFVLSFIWGFLIWAYSSYNFFFDFWMESAEEAFSESVSDVYTWVDATEIGQNLESQFEEKRKELINKFDEEREKIKENIEENIREYIDQQLDEWFWND